jgi:hypothetical protein
MSFISIHASNKSMRRGHGGLRGEDNGVNAVAVTSLFSVPSHLLFTTARKGSRFGEHIAAPDFSREARGGPRRRKGR